MSITQREESGSMEFPALVNPTQPDLYCLESLSISNRKTSGGMGTKANPLSF